MKRLALVVVLSSLTLAPVGARADASPCESPPPAVLYADTVTTPAPTPPDGGVVILTASIDPLIDADLFICGDPASEGGLAQGANILGEPCDNHLGPNSMVPVGCHETASSPVTPGRTYTIRVVGILPGQANLRYWFSFA